MLEQFGREFLQLYPQARVLVAQREDLQADRRRLFVARCATGDWDAVILSRSAFERIPMSPAAQRAYLNRELDQIREQIRRSKGGEGLTVKRLEAALLRAEERLKGQARLGPGPGHHVRGDRHRLLVRRRGTWLQEPAHPVQHRGRGDRRVDARLRPGHEDQLPAGTQRHTCRHLRHRHAHRQQHHRGLRDAALPAARPAPGRGHRRLRHLGRHLRPDRGARSRWPPKEATASGRRPASPSSPTCRRCCGCGTSPPTSRPAKTCTFPPRPWPGGQPTASACQRPSSCRPPTRCSATWPSSGSGLTRSAAGRSGRKRTTCSRCRATAAKPPSTCGSSASP